MFTSTTTIRACALAMMSGGAMWIIKAVLILVGNGQPPLVFELAQMLFAVGLIGLYVLGGEGGAARIGLVAALIGLLSRTAATVYELIPGAQVSRGDDFLFPYSVLVLLGALGPFVGLLALGLATLRRTRFPWRQFPVVMAILVLPIGATALLHIELPILLLGTLWLLLGYLLWRSAATHLVPRRS